MNTWAVLARQHWGFVGILLGIILANILWIQHDQSPPMWDMAGHSARATVFSDLISGFHPNAILHYPSIYPPLAYVITGKWLWLVGNHPDIPQYSLLFFVILAAVSMYGLGLELWQRRGLALLGVATFFAIPLVAHFSRIYDLDFPLTAMVAATVYAAVRSRGFSQPGWTVVVGILCGLGMLTKWTFGVFVLGPLLYVFITHRAGRHIKNIAWAIIIALILALPWYIVHWEQLRGSAEATRQNVFSVPVQDLTSFDNATFYLTQLWRTLPWPVFLLGALGLGLMVMKKHQRLLLLLSWIILPYIIMTWFVASKESRYLLPLFPAIALAAAGVVALSKKMVIVGTFIAISLLVVYAQTSWNVPFLPTKAVGLSAAYGFQEITLERPYYGFTYPTAYAINLNQVFEKIQANAINLPQPIKIAVVPNSMFLSDAQFRWLGAQHALAVDLRLSGRLRSASWPAHLVQADYVITKTGHQGPGAWTPHLHEIQQAEAAGDAVFSTFEKIGEWRMNFPVEGRQTVRLYQQK